VTVRRHPLAAGVYFRMPAATARRWLFPAEYLTHDLQASDALLAPLFRRAVMSLGRTLPFAIAIAVIAWPARRGR